MSREESGYTCVYCKTTIFADESMRGAGDGIGKNFAHNDCYWRKEAEYWQEDRDRWHKEAKFQQGESLHWRREVVRLQDKIEAAQETLED